MPGSPKDPASEGVPKLPPPEQDAYVALLRGQDRLQAETSALLKSHGLSHQQYNVLRILRGAGPDGAPCQQIAERMINRDPDVTRLLDRLVKAGFVVRERATRDRRVVLAKISPEGLARLAVLDEPVLALHREQFAVFSPSELETLVGLLRRVGDV